MDDDVTVGAIGSASPPAVAIAPPFIAPDILQKADIPRTRQRLRRIIDTEIVPRLIAMQAERDGSAERPGHHPEKVEIAALATRLLDPGSQLSPGFLGDLEERGFTMEDIFVHMLEPAARVMGEMWERDECDFIDVALGVGRLQQLMSTISHANPRHPAPPSPAHPASQPLILRSGQSPRLEGRATPGAAPKPDHPAWFETAAARPPHHEGHGGDPAPQAAAGSSPPASTPSAASQPLILRSGQSPRLEGRTMPGAAPELPPVALQRVCMMTLADERHSLGVSMIETLLRAAGWEVRSERGATLRGVEAVMSRERFAVVGLAVSSDRDLDAVAAMIRAIRRHARNPSLGIMVGGAPFSERPALAAEVGADATALNAASAVLLARKLFDRGIGQRSLAVANA